MSYHVVLADDDTNITKGLSDILRGHFPGVFTIHCVESGTALRKLLCTEPVALVISDIKMPGMTGIECLGFIREQQLACEVVLLSGYDDYPLLRQAISLKAADYMLKPVHIDSLVSLITRLLPQLGERTFAPAPETEEAPRAMTAAPYFDIAVDAPLDGDALCAALEDFVRAMQSQDEPAMERALHTFFAGNDGSALDEAATKNALIRSTYQLMERIPAMIKIIADNKLTSYDAVSSIKNLPTLSQLRDRLLDTFRHDMAQLREALRRQAGEKDQHLIRRAKAYIAAHYMENISLEDVAGELYLQPNYFCTLFRRLNGEGFREYLRKERIAHAQALILEGRYRLYEVAERVGYQDTSHFNRAFKEVTGVTPSKWALHHKKQ